MRVSADDAAFFWSHPSQHESGLTGSDLPEWAVYFARSGVCLAFHPCPVHGAWFVHVGVTPAAWGGTVDQVRLLLAEFAAEFGPSCVIAWVSDKKRAAILLARRAGFSDVGSAGGAKILEWRP